MVNRPGLRARRWVRRALDRLEREGSAKALITLNLAARWPAVSSNAQTGDSTRPLTGALLPIPNA
jgi:hypothetical protein